MWVRVDDTFPEHRKVVEAGRHLGTYGQGRVIAIWLVGMAYCNRNLNDGVITESTVKTWTLFDRRPLDVVKVMAMPMPDGSSGLLEPLPAAGDRWRFHDYGLYQPLAREVKTKRDWETRRKQLYAIPGLVDAVRARDLNACRYCAVTVNWKDRRGSHGGTYDLVDPRGQTRLDNVVVACHGCNAIKAGRLLEESGLTLLPPPHGNGPGSGLDTGRDWNQIRPSSDFVGDQRVPDPTRSRVQKKDHALTRGWTDAVANDRVLKALVWRETHAVFAAATEEFSLPHLTELLKCAAARAGLRYDSEFFHQQVEIAFVRVPLQQRRGHRRSAA